MSERDDDDDDENALIVNDKYVDVENNNDEEDEDFVMKNNDDDDDDDGGSDNSNSSSSNSSEEDEDELVKETELLAKCYKYVIPNTRKFNAENADNYTASVIAARNMVNCAPLTEQQKCILERVNFATGRDAFTYNITNNDAIIAAVNTDNTLIKSYREWTPEMMPTLKVLIDKNAALLENGVPKKLPASFTCEPPLQEMLFAAATFTEDDIVYFKENTYRAKRNDCENPYTFKTCLCDFRNATTLRNVR